MARINVAQLVFAVIGLLFVIAALLPALGGHPVKTGLLGTAVVLFLLALGVKPRRPSAPPSGPGA